MLRLTPDELETVKTIIHSVIPEHEVRAFGSRVAGNFKKYSDLDLVIVGEHKIDRKILIQLKEKFQESDLSFRVDILDWARISPEFKKVIEIGYEIIQTEV